MVTADITIVESLPPGAKWVPERTLDEQIELSGAPRTLSELIYEFSMLVPADFPDFTFNDSGGIIRLVSSRLLREEERVAALNAFHRRLPGVELEFHVNPERSIPDALPLSPSLRRPVSGP